MPRQAGVKPWRGLPPQGLQTLRIAMIKRKGKIEPPLYDIEKIQHDNPNPVFGTTGSVLTRDTPLVHFREQNANN